MMENKPQYLIIEDIIKSKNPALLKILPSFILKYIKKTLHQDEMNAIIKRNYKLQGLEFAEQIAFKELQIKPVLHGEENIPKEGRFLFAGNHPWGAMEAVSLLVILGKKFETVRFVVNDILMHIKNYEPLFIPVNKHGAQGRENVKILENTFKSDAQIIIFPSGLVSRKIKGKVQDLEWKKNFISKAIQHKRDIIPFFIDGENSAFFYRLANFRKAIGIKANIEMFYLADEMFKHKGKELHYYFGKAIPYQTFTKEKSLQEWALKVREHSYLLKENPNRDFL